MLQCKLRYIRGVDSISTENIHICLGDNCAPLGCNAMTHIGFEQNKIYMQCLWIGVRDWRCVSFGFHRSVYFVGEQNKIILYDCVSWMNSSERIRNSIPTNSGNMFYSSYRQCSHASLDASLMLQTTLCVICSQKFRQKYSRGTKKKILFVYVETAKLHFVKMKINKWNAFGHPCQQKIEINEFHQWRPKL